MVVEMLRQIEQPFAVIINRAEADSDYLIEEYCQQEEIKVLLKIPFSRKIAELYSNGIPFVNQIEGWESKFKKLYQNILEEADRYERNNSN
jgi:MinD superfamily P-loop ATPase